MEYTQAAVREQQFVYEDITSSDADSARRVCTVWLFNGDGPQEFLDCDDFGGCCAGWCAMWCQSTNRGHAEKHNEH